MKEDVQKLIESKAGRLGDRCQKGQIKEEVKRKAEERRKDHAGRTYNSLYIMVESLWTFEAETRIGSPRMRFQMTL